MAKPSTIAKLEKQLLAAHKSEMLTFHPRLQAAAKRRVANLQKRLDKARRDNPVPTIKPGKWIKAQAVRVRKVAGRVVLDIKREISSPNPRRGPGGKFKADSPRLKQLKHELKLALARQRTRLRGGLS